MKNRSRETYFRLLIFEKSLNFAQQLVAGVCLYFVNSKKFCNFAVSKGVSLPK